MYIKKITIYYQLLSIIYYYQRCGGPRRYLRIGRLYIVMTTDHVGSRRSGKRRFSDAECGRGQGRALRYYRPQQSSASVQRMQGTGIRFAVLPLGQARMAFRYNAAITRISVYHGGRNGFPANCRQPRKESLYSDGVDPVSRLNALEK